jgi:predicted esterase
MAVIDHGRHPHGGQRIVTAGAPLEEATGAIVAIHGRGADAADIIALAREVAPQGVAIVAPQAAGHTWYPYSFLEPIERNEPYLSSALRRIGDLIGELGSRGITHDRVALLGFSQGACLALETAARSPQRYAAVIGFSGGLIGPPGTQFDYDGSLQDTPVFIGCSDVDPHIPKERVEESATALVRLDAAVDARIYPGMGHTVNQDELNAVRAMLEVAFGPSLASLYEDLSERQ